MTIRRAPRPRRYTVVPNATLEDSGLSFKALGLLVYLLSKPDHWTVSREHLATTHTDGVDSIRSGLRELRSAGYVTDEIERDDSGRIAERSLVVHDFPVGEPTGGKPTSRPRHQVDDAALVSTEAKQGLTEVSTDPGETHNGELARSAPSQPSLLPAVTDLPVGRTYEPSTGDLAFDEFWRVYPRRAAKVAARKAWRKALRQAPDHVIVAGAARYRDDPGRDPEYTPHPAKWLNDGRWDDEPLPARAGGATKVQQSVARLATDRAQQGSAVDVAALGLAERRRTAFRPATRHRELPT